jgi:hypothetical protein
MRRLVYGSASLFTLACLVAAWVNAQERGVSSVSQTTGWRTADRTANLLAADVDNMGGLYSVLKRPDKAADEGEKPASSNGPPELPEDSSDVGIRTAARPTDLRNPNVSGDEDGDQEAENGAPLDSSRRRSSRRTYQPPPADPQEAQQDPEPQRWNQPSTPTDSVAPERPIPKAPMKSEVSARPTTTATLSTTTGTSLRVETIGPEAITLGEEAAFVVRVANLSDQPAVGAKIQVDIPDTVQVKAVEAGAGAAETAAADSPDRQAAASKIVWRLERVAARTVQEMALRLIPQSHQPFELAVDWSVQPMRSIFSSTRSLSAVYSSSATGRSGSR